MDKSQRVQDAVGALNYALDVIEKKKQPLLVIELHDESSMPKVFYEGVELTKKLEYHSTGKQKQMSLEEQGITLNITLMVKDIQLKKVMV